MSNGIVNLYFYFDESGLLNLYDEYAIYGGVFFHNRNDRDNMLREFRAYKEKIKHNYCINNNTCNKNNSNCNKELKSREINFNKHHVNLYKLIKKYNCTFAVINENHKMMNTNNLINELDRNRYKDFIITRVIEKVVGDYISNSNDNEITKYNIYITLDEQSTKSNSLYKLAERVKYNLFYNRIKYSKYKNAKYEFPRIIDNLKCGRIEIVYKCSNDSDFIQASDIIVGYINKKIKHFKRMNIIEDIIIVKAMEYLDYSIKLP